VKILKIDIKGFGKLTDFVAEPSPGFNLVFGMNESGKSTLQAFIGCALFGITDSEKVKYKPWLSDVYAGSLTYKLDNGSIYSIYRDIANDVFILSNENGEVISKDDAEIEKQLGIDRDVFYASAYMEQARIRFEPEMKEHLEQKFADLYRTDFKDVTVEETIELLSKYRQTNEIGEIEKEITELRKKIGSADDEINADPSKKNEELSQQVQRYNLIRRNFDDLEHEMREKTKLKTFLDRRNEKSVNTGYDKNDLLKLISLKNKYITVSSRKSVLLIIFFIICTGAIGLGVFSVVNNSNDLFWIALAVLGLSFIILLTEGLLVLLKGRMLRSLQKQMNELAVKNCLSPDIGMNELLRIEPEPSFVPMDIGEINEKLDKCDETIKLRFAAIRLNADRDISTMEMVPDYVADLEKRVREMSAVSRGRNNEDRAAANARYTAQLAALEEKKNRMKKALKVLDVTIDTVRNSSREVDLDCSVYYNDELTRMMRSVTSGRYSSFDLRGPDPGMISPETGELLGPEDLSTGTAEQFYLAMRLAALFILSKKGEKVPVFMDEIFAYSDERRIAESLKFLNAEKNDHQMFYFTCRRTEGSMVKAIVGDDLNIIRLKV
jgi:uncharacterized protein YhaN